MKLFDHINAITWLYKESSIDATRALWRNWPLLIGVIISSLIVFLVTFLFGQSGFAGGMIIGLVQIVLISIGYSWLRDSVSRERLLFKGLYQLDVGLFSSVINTAFILFIGKFLLSLFAQAPGFEWVMVLVQFGLVIVCNALPEVLYIQRYEGVAALQESIDFIKRNWIEWFLPLVLIAVPWIFISVDMLLFLVAKMDELLPATIVFHIVRVFSSSFLNGIGPVGTFLSYFLALILFVWFMLFRGFLFSGMVNGSRRQRAFKAKH